MGIDGNYFFYIDIVVFVSLIIAIFSGLIAGFDRKINKLIVILIPTILLFIFINPISEKAMTFEVAYNDLASDTSILPDLGLTEEQKAEKHSIKELVTNVVVTQIFDGDVNMKDGKTAELVSSLSEMIVKIVVYFILVIGVFIIQLVLSMIFAILRGIFGIKLKRRRRLLGIVGGVLEFAVFFILVYLPFFGVCSLAATVINDVEPYSEELGIDENTKDGMMDFASAVDESLVIKYVLTPATNFLCTDKSITCDAQYVGNALSFTVDGEQVKLLDEYKNIKPAIPTILTIASLFSDTSSGIDLSKLTADDIDNVTRLLSDSNFLKTIIPAGLEVAAYKAEAGDMKDILNSLKTVNWDTELDKLGAAIGTLKNHLDVKVNVGGLDEILASEGLPEAAKDIVKALMELETFDKLILPLIVNALVDNIDKLDTSGIINIENVKNAEWKDEINVVLDVLVVLANSYKDLEFDANDWSKVLDNPKLSEIVNNAVTEIMKSKLVKEEILPVLGDKLNKLILEQSASGMNIEFVAEMINKDTIIELLENDIDELIVVLKDVKNLGFFDNSVALDFNDTTCQDNIIGLIKDLFKLSIINGKEADILNSLFKMVNLDTTFESFGLTMDFNKVTDWDKEIDNIGNIFKNVMALSGDLTGFDLGSLFTGEANAEKKELIARTIELISKDQVLGDSMYSLLDNLLKTVSPDYTVSFTNADKAAIENETGWYNETMVILDIVSEAGDIIQGKVGLDSLDETQIRSIMTKASNSVVACKVLGGLLSTALGSMVDYDFSTRSGMASGIDIVCSAIQLSKCVTGDSFDLNDVDDVSTLLDAVSSLGSTDEGMELANELIATVTGDDTINVTKEEVQEAVSTMQSVIDAYQNSADQENFDYDELPQDLKDKLDDSELAKALLDLLLNP